MEINEAKAWLDSRVNIEAMTTPGRGRAPSLDAMRELAALLGDPQTAFPAIHITGTNGKTSTARIASRLLEVAGLSVGILTSPDLERLNERLAWNSEPIDDVRLAEALSAVEAVVALMSNAPSRFDILTGAALWWFAEIAVHAAVIEVGLLGTWDSTNVVDGSVAVITNVGADHLDYAGTVENVAKEKAGIVKPGSILVLGEIDPDFAPIFAATPADEIWRMGDDFAVLDNRLALGGRLLTVRTPTSMYEEVFLPLHGAHQGDNAALALVAVEAFLGGPLDQELIAEAFERVRSPGRLEVMGSEPLLLLDGAHNAAGASVLAGAVEEGFPEPDRWTLVVGLLQPHDPREFLEALDLRGVERIVACEAASPRAVPAGEIAAAARAMGVTEVEAAAGVPDALARALAGSAADDGVLVTGSLWVVGEARAAIGRGVG